MKTHNISQIMYTLNVLLKGDASSSNLGTSLRLWGYQDAALQAPLANYAYLQ